MKAHHDLSDHAGGRRVNGDATHIAVSKRRLGIGRRCTEREREVPKKSMRWPSDVHDVGCAEAKGVTTTRGTCRSSSERAHTVWHHRNQKAANPRDMQTQHGTANAPLLAIASESRRRMRLVTQEIEIEFLLCRRTGRNSVGGERLPTAMQGCGRQTEHQCQSITKFTHSQTTSARSAWTKKGCNTVDHARIRSRH